MASFTYCGGLFLFVFVVAAAAEDGEVAQPDATKSSSRSFFRCCALCGMVVALVSFVGYTIKDIKTSIGGDKSVFARRLRANPCSALKNPFVLYLAFLVSGALVYFLIAGTFSQISSMHLLDWGGSIAESFGLLVLQYKISNRESVAGISGHSIIMFLLTYTFRCWQLIPPFAMFAVNRWVLEMFCFVSLVQVLVIAWAVFKTYRRTYQEELDVLKFYYVVPACFIVAVLFHPFLQDGFFASFLWSFIFYMDVAALCPQVAMMAQSGGKIKAPVAHFVAATAMSRAIDLWFWYDDHELGAQGYIYGFNYSGCLIVFVHFLNLVLVADFLYYYIKARLAGAAMSEDLALPM